MDFGNVKIQRARAISHPSRKVPSLLINIAETDFVKRKMYRFDIFRHFWQSFFLCCDGRPVPHAPGFLNSRPKHHIFSLLPALGGSSITGVKITSMRLVNNLIRVVYHLKFYYM